MFGWTRCRSSGVCVWLDTLQVNRCVCFCGRGSRCKVLRVSKRDSRRVESPAAGHARKPGKKRTPEKTWPTSGPDLVWTRLLCPLVAPSGGESLYLTAPQN